MAKIKSLNQYNKKYRKCKSSLIQFTKKEIEEQAKTNNCSVEFLLKGKKWIKIGQNYLEIPRAFTKKWFVSLSASAKLACGTILTGAAAAAIAVPVIIRANMIIVDKFIAFDDDKSSFADLPDATEKDKREIKENLTADVSVQSGGDKKFTLSFKNESTAAKFDIAGVISVKANGNLLNGGASNAADYKVVNKGIDDIYVIVYKNALQTYGENIKITPKISGYLTRQSVTIDCQNETTPTVVKCKKGNTIEKPSNPTYTGYNFKGWYTKSSEGEIFNFDNPINNDLTIYGQWSPKTYNITTTPVEHVTSYTVESTASYKSTVNVSALADTGYDIDEIIVKQGEEVVETITGSSGNFVMPAGDVTITATTVPHDYTITYHNVNPDEHENVESYTIESDDITLTAASRTGYTFLGWYKDSGFAQEITTIQKGSTGDLNIYAKWSSAIEYTITYDLDGGTNNPGNPSKYTVESETITLKDPTKTGYPFAGWYKNQEKTEQITEIDVSQAKDITIYAKWGAPTEYTITYHNCDGITGTNPNPTKYNVTSDITLQNVSKIGYTFGGWYLDDGFSQSITQIKNRTGNLDIYAKFTVKKFTISITVDPIKGGSCTGAGEVQEGQPATLTATANPGYKFVKWNDGTKDITANPYTIDSVMSNINLTAIFEALPHNVNIGTLPAGISSITTSPSTTAKTDETVTVTVNVKNGYNLTSLKVKYNDGAAKEIDLPTTGTKSFTMPAYDVTIVGTTNAITYTISYELNGGTGPTPANPTSYTVETETITLGNPTKAGYDFGGWYENVQFTGSAVTTIQKGSTGNKSLYAKWTPTTYTITYNNVTGATNPNPASYNIETAVTLSAATKAGYDFVNWYDNSSCTGTPVTSIPLGSTGNKEFWAKWQIVTYTISYDLDGGTAPTPANPTTYTVETPTITLNNPTKEHYTFDGWYTAKTGGSKVTQIALGSTGNMNLFARYTAVPQYTISVTSDDTYKGTVSGGGTVYKGEQVTVTASPKDDRKFLGWYNGGTKVSDDVSYTFKPEASATLKAKFDVNTYEVSSTFKEIPLYTKYVNGDSLTITYSPTETKKYLMYYLNSMVDVKQYFMLNYVKDADGNDINYWQHSTCKGLWEVDGGFESGKTYVLKITFNSNDPDRKDKYLQFSN